MLGYHRYSPHRVRVSGPSHRVSSLKIKSSDLSQYDYLEQPEVVKTYVMLSPHHTGTHKTAETLSIVLRACLDQGICASLPDECRSIILIPFPSVT